MTGKILPLLLAALFASSCTSAARKKDRADAEAAVAAAGAALAVARQAGGEVYDASRIRMVETDLQRAREKLKAGDWEEARRYAHLADGVADDIRNDAEAARKRDSARKKTRIPVPRKNP
ncbi:MAG: hypothetical protein Q8T11_07215 [Elusimicrobiota bacterium]|nr:hypothetical protein [Elusimicrobiota bacterium]